MKKYLVEYGAKIGGHLFINAENEEEAKEEAKSEIGFHDFIEIVNLDAMEQ